MKLVEDEQRLRFRSHFEITSLKRRESAISRVLAGQSRIPDLIQIFDPSSGRVPQIGVTKVDPLVYEKKYGLNSKQAVALSELRELRPVGLVQGPPGTGKTVFIAALVHDALTSGLARNVLVASQSHVRNNADGLQENGVATIAPGFMSRDNRINVAISRAMDRLVIVGSKGRWPAGGPMSRVVEAFAAEVKVEEAKVIPAVAIYDENGSPRPRAKRPEKQAPGAAPASTGA